MTPPPIASPHAHEESAPSKPPFRGLRVFIGIDVVLFVLSFIRTLLDPESFLLIFWMLGATAITSVLYGLLLWHLSRGSNSARTIYWWLHVLLLAFVVLVPDSLASFSLWFQLIDWLSCAFSLFGLVWLQLPGVKAHFQKSS